MPSTQQVPATFPMHNGSELGLRVSRLDERQRRLRINLPKTATCWDYAPLIDVVWLEPGFKIHRFTGLSAAQWLEKLRNDCSLEYTSFCNWYESLVNLNLDALSKHPRVPDNHYCIELAVPPLEPTLPRMIRHMGLKRASVEQWSATLRSLTTKGLKPEELEESGVLIRLQQLPTGSKPTQTDVIKMINLSQVLPKFACESRFGFVATDGWHEHCYRIPSREFRRRGLLGKGHHAWHIIRFQHRTLNWSIVRSRYKDLLTEKMDWWSVLDKNGRFIQQPSSGFDSPDDAMEFAKLRMSQQFAAFGKNQMLSKWERYSLPGGDGYREILLQLDDWPYNYHPRHYRTRNVLVHIRTSIRQTLDGRRVLFLDEIQSDWHADLHAQMKSDALKRPKTPPAAAPFRKEWPLLAMKLMVWWGQRLGVHGVSWSTAELQLKRWHGYGPPETFYRKILPDAAYTVATTLNLPQEITSLSVRTSHHRVELREHGWDVCNQADVPITKPFRTRAQAEHFANLIGKFEVTDVPVIWINGLAPIHSIPIYGTGTSEMWQEPQTHTLPTIAGKQKQP